MLIRERRSGDVTILDLKATMPGPSGDAALKDAVQGLLHEGRRKIVLNLDAVPSLDSTALGMLVSAQVTAGRQDGSLKLANVTDRNRELLRIVRLGDLFEVFDTEEAAVASYS